MCHFYLYMALSCTTAIILRGLFKFYTEERQRCFQCIGRAKQNKTKKNPKKCLPQGDVCLSIEKGGGGGIWGWPWAGRLLAASWRVQSVGAAGACLAWLGGRRGKTGRHKIKSNSATNRTQAYAHTDPWPQHYKRQHSNMSNIWFAKCS